MNLFFQLRKHFLNSLSPRRKKRFLITDWNQKTKILVKAVAHEIKGTGGSIRQPELTNIGEEIENMISSGNVNWDIINLNAARFFQLLAIWKTAVLTWSNNERYIGFIIVIIAIIGGFKRWQAETCCYTSVGKFVIINRHCGRKFVHYGYPSLLKKIIKAILPGTMKGHGYSKQD
jgi:hypothetical protein